MIPREDILFSLQRTSKLRFLRAQGFQGFEFEVLRRLQGFWGADVPRDS